jgi:hypothetical protein
MESIIKWNKIDEIKPPEFGWVVVILKPVNHKECEQSAISMNDWISQFGFDKVWYNNFKFWDSKKGYGIDITDRIIYWAEVPNIFVD